MSHIGTQLRTCQLICKTIHKSPLQILKSTHNLTMSNLEALVFDSSKMLLNSQ